MLPTFTHEPADVVVTLGAVGVVHVQVVPLHSGNCPVSHVLGSGSDGRVPHVQAVPFQLGIWLAEQPEGSAGPWGVVAQVHAVPFQLGIWFAEQPEGSAGPVDVVVAQVQAVPFHEAISPGEAHVTGNCADEDCGVVQVHAVPLHEASSPLVSQFGSSGFGSVVQVHVLPFHVTVCPAKQPVGIRGEQVH